MVSKTTTLSIIMLLIGVVIGVVGGYFTGASLGKGSVQTLTMPITSIYTSYLTTTQIQTETRIMTSQIVTTVLTTPQYPKTIVDALGREIRIDKEPMRIVSTMPSITEELFALGLGFKVVGVDSYSNYPPEVINLRKEGKIADVGGPWTLDLEKIISLRPDIVFLCRGVSVHESLYAPKLEERGLKTVFLLCDSAKDQYDIYRDLRLIASIFNRDDVAESLIKTIDKKINDVIEKLKTQNVSKPNVLILLGPPSWGLWSAGGNTFISWLITTAGGVNIASQYSGWPQLDYEYILSKNPEIIIITAHGINMSQLKKELEQTPLSKTKAWTDGKIYLLSGDANDMVLRPGPRIADALDMLSKIIHPEIFGELSRSDVQKILVIMPIILVVKR
ncbi:MAG: ABC transporter substrate-binding protein [Desulfurococcales archaeon]|nr:ABC transporter substrate-binding protein [Desulfurococcales archaeon]